MLKNNVKKQILEAFPNALVPREILVNPSDWLVGDIPQSACKELHLKSWDEVLLNNWLCIATIPSVMSILKPQAFHYYLPSLLTGVMDNPDYFDWGVSALLPNNKNHERKGVWWIEYESLFNAPQRRAMMIFFDYIEEESDGLNESKYLAQTAKIFWMDSVKAASVE